MNHVPFFTVLPGDERPPKTARNQAFLAPDNWNDWHEFRTLYQLSFVDASGAQHYVGGVKIGQFGTFLPGGRPQIPTAFDTLSEEFFSLGQSDEYYERLNLLGATVRGRVLSGLCDVALDLPRFDRAVFTAVMQRSLLRSITENTVRVQFHRMANGGARLSAYEFVFSTATSGPTDGLALEFSVTPNSRPPTNIHVLIGRNGVGKTRTLTSMVRSLVDDVGLEYGVFSLNGRQSRSSQLFSNVVSVTFSAFDNFVPPRAYGEAAAQRRYTYIGLNQGMGAGRVGKFRPKDHRALADEFGESVAQCSEGARLRRWKRAMHTLESDPMFKEFGITDLPAEASEERQGSTLSREQLVAKRAAELFAKLSSGHKLVALTVSRLVETVEEKTLVLFDEPEAHLHPPLLSALVRALSDLLVDRNGVAVIATHSPVILQEVPRKCVWKMRRSGHAVVVERPEIETFGENVGVLTRDVFGLEVTSSGFHRLLDEQIAADRKFDDIVQIFGGELGSEARAIARARMAAQAREEHG